ncbi:MAG: TetR family transcriptional regulator [Actinomycetota bacterium]|nr:TetR family transcriptional regulator [Actinomycetota bacterium]
MSVSPKTEDKPGTMRRAPVQARSQERVKLLLDTTAALVDEVGIEGVTTGLLAERAEVSIGSVYRFFPDRISLMKALSARNLQRFGERYLAEFERLQVDTWQEAVDVTIAQFVEMLENEPGFRALRFGDVIDEQLLDGEDRNTRLRIESFTYLLTERLGVKENENLERQVQVVTEICDSLLTRAFLEDPAGDRWMIDECRAVVRNYMDERLETV